MAPETVVATGDGIRGEDLRRNRIPMYLQLADIMRRRISNDAWPIGKQIPTLETLMAEFGVARVTVRQALGILEDEGLISRHRAKGSFVVKRPMAERWLSLKTDLYSLEGPIRSADTRFLICRPASGQPKLDPTEGKLAESYQYIRREIARGGIPYAIVDVHLDRTLFERHDPKDLEQKTIITMMQATPELGPLEGHQTLTISSADAEISKLLAMPINGPIAQVRRVLRNRDGVAIYIADVIYRGEFVRLDIELT